jgi:hypothetical protein
MQSQSENSIATPQVSSDLRRTICLIQKKELMDIVPHWIRRCIALALAQKESAALASTDHKTRSGKCRAAGTVSVAPMNKNDERMIHD